MQFRNAVRAIIFNSEKELLIVNMGNVWAIPGGGIEFGENFYQALEREIYEELGIQAKADKLVFIQDYVGKRKGEDTHFIEFFYTIKNNKDFENVLDTYQKSSHAFELKNIKWSSLDNLPEDFMPKALVDVLRKYLKNGEVFSYVSGI